MLGNAFLLAFRQILRNPMRSLLTVLGIVIGVAAVITMVTVGNGATQAVKEQIESFGSNQLMLRKGQRLGPGGAAGAPSFKLEDVEALVDQIGGVTSAVPKSQRNTIVVANGKNWTTIVIGSTSDYFTIDNRTLAQGRYFEPSEEMSGAAVCVIGTTIQKELFGAGVPVVGEMLRVNAFSCRIVGLLGEKGTAAMGGDQDDLVARKICELEGVDSYRTDGFVLEGGSIHVDGQGTVLTTEMCLLSPGRNPELSRRDIEEKLCGYLGCEKVIWLRDGIDPDETNGHIDDVACFVAPGEVACIWTEDPENPFYQAAQDAFRTLSQATDAKGRRLTVHKLCLTKKPCCLEGAETIDAVEGTVPRENGEVSIASYMNFLIVNGAVIAPQYGDENDQLAIQQLQQMFPDRQIVGVQTREVAFGGGNIHCITQQQPKA